MAVAEITPVPEIVAFELEQLQVPPDTPSVSVAGMPMQIRLLPMMVPADAEVTTFSVVATLLVPHVLDAV